MYIMEIDDESSVVHSFFLSVDLTNEQCSKLQMMMMIYIYMNKINVY